MRCWQMVLLVLGSMFAAEGAAVAAEGAAVAAEGAAGGAGPVPKRFSLSLKNENARATFYRIGKESGQTVLPDSTLNRGLVTAEWKDVTVEEALEAACKQLNASWRRVYLPPGTAANADNVSQIYRSLVAFEPGMGRGTVLLLNAKLPAEYEKVMEQPDTAFRRAYLDLRLHTPLVPQRAAGDDGKPWQPGDTLTPAKLARLSGDLLSALSQMSPEERQAALQAQIASQMEAFARNPQMMAQFVKESAGIQLQFMAQNPELVQTITQSAMQAQIEVIQQMTPEQRQAWAKAQMDVIKQIPPEQMKQLTDLMRPPAK